ncbi:hypothetical protein BT63DRAFT_457491 [Microthyrium microscopicum]|uniref:Uncharacterized protein n=1 Tax=Microthyrium microscopicum TaxID=703497 RepID=A0A6A6U344_9PEZI|nr:hypothetical protein BT63DRAFT_457491 [Microthyrium microscopicum]
MPAINHSDELFKKWYDSRGGDFGPPRNHLVENSLNATPTQDTAKRSSAMESKLQQGQELDAPLETFANDKGGQHTMIALQPVMGNHPRVSKPEIQAAVISDGKECQDLMNDINLLAYTSLVEQIAHPPSEDTNTSDTAATPPLPTPSTATVVTAPEQHETNPARTLTALPTKQARFWSLEGAMSLPPTLSSKRYYNSSAMLQALLLIRPMNLYSYCFKALPTQDVSE